jgi:AraC-like DNA-binding protein
MRRRAKGGNDLGGVLRRKSFAAAEGEAFDTGFLDISVMNSAMINPFPHDPDRHELWEMVIHRDIEAFMAKDWDLMKREFIEEGFFGIDGRLLTSIDSWRLTFPNLDAYRKEWLKQANDYARRFKTGLREALYHAMKLTQIEIIGDTALLHRKFDGWLTRTNGHRVNLQWQTLYLCRKHEGRWKIASFTGYLPNVIFERPTHDDAPQKGPTAGIWQHVNSLSDVSALKTLLVEIEQSRQSGMGTDEQQWLDRACALLGEQPAKQAGFATLAKQLGVSYEVFRRRFRRLTGMSPHHYRQSRLIEQACRLLCTTRHTVAEVAFELGFCDEFHFSHSFKKVIGQSPKDFRKCFLVAEA